MDEMKKTVQADRERACVMGWCWYIIAIKAEKEERRVASGAGRWKKWKDGVMVDQAGMLEDLGVGVGGYRESSWVRVWPSEMKAAAERRSRDGERGVKKQKAGWRNGSGDLQGREQEMKNFTSGWQQSWDDTSALHLWFKLNLSETESYKCVKK